jgi:hypothetical protein
VDKWYAGDDSVHPTTFPIDPFRLAEIIKAPGEAGQIDAVVFNPFVVSSGEWRSAVEPIPVSNYCRFMAEIRPETERLAKETETKFGHLSDPKTRKEAMEWVTPLAEDIADNARARIAEWEVGSDS